MNLHQLMIQALEQSGMETDELEDLRPLLVNSANTAYDGLTMALRSNHVGLEEDEDEPLCRDRDIPDIPEWTHCGICDYLSFVLARSAGPARAAKAQAFYGSWLSILSRARCEGGNVFINLP